MLEPNRVDPDDWYEFNNQQQIICGSCLNEDLIKTERGEYKEEAVTLSMVHRLDDADDEPYQCDTCNLQSEGYDLLDNPDLD